MPRIKPESPRIIIIGAGMSGLCMAIRLKKAGFDDLMIIESAEEVGGTWYKNSYPNAGCDIPSYLYCYSFAPNYAWSMKYARQPEILAYFRDCADRFSIRKHIRFGTTVESASFDEVEMNWNVKTSDGATLTAEILVSAVGQLNRPNVPSIPGMDDFSGQVWHSARWNHEYDFEGKTVAIIGNGASAIQFVPDVARRAQRTIVFQRTPSWIHPLKNYRYPAPVRWAFRTLPLCARLHRYWIFSACDMRVYAFESNSILNREYARWLRSRMRKLIPVDQRPTLIPDYSPGCKRVLLSSDYLQALQREDVTVISNPIERFQSNQIVTSRDKFTIDAAILATGFKANDLLQPMEVAGRSGQLLHDKWAGHPKAFYGIATAGFPNLFLLYGPNTNLGHNSIIFMVERQVDYIMKCLDKLRKSRARSIEVKRESMDRYNEQLQAELGSSIWAEDCTSWYKNSDGTIPNNWAGSATAFWRRLRRPRFSDFEFSEALRC